MKGPIVSVSAQMSGSSSSSSSSSSSFQDKQYRDPDETLVPPALIEQARSRPVGGDSDDDRDNNDNNLVDVNDIQQTIRSFMPTPTSTGRKEKDNKNHMRPFGEGDTEQALKERDFLVDALKLMQEVNGPRTHEVDYVVEELLQAADREERVSIVRQNANHLFTSDGVRRFIGIAANAEDGGELQARVLLLHEEVRDMLNTEPSLAEARENAVAMQRQKEEEEEQELQETIQDVERDMMEAYEEQVKQFEMRVDLLEEAYISRDQKGDTDETKWKNLLMNTCDVFTARLGAEDPKAPSLTARMLAIVEAALPIAPLSDAERAALNSAMDVWKC